VLIERDIRDFKMLLDSEDEGMSQTLLAGRGWEGRCPDALSEVIKPGMNVLELGACIGYYVMVECAAGGNVWALEPDPVNVARIRRNLALNGYSAVTHQMAIGAEDGVGHFHPSKGRSDRGRIIDRAGGIEVPLVSLDSLVEGEQIDQVDLIRCDIEGAEVGMVEGGHTVLREMGEGSFICIDLHPLKEKILPTVEAIIGHGFEPVEVFAPAWLAQVKREDFPAAASKNGFPRVLFRKCA